MADLRRECCRNEANLGNAVQVNPSVSYRRCAVCQCRHFEMTVDPGSLGIRGAGM